MGGTGNTPNDRAFLDPPRCWFHAAMTNQQPSPCADAVDASITSMVHAGGHRRPVKIVEHPAFRRWQQPAERGDLAA